MKFPLPITHLAEGLLDALAPARCISCLQEGTWYCAACRAVAPIHLLTCIVCEQEHPRGTTCSGCREETPLTGLVSVGSYSNRSLQRGIEWLKFKGVRPIADILGALIVPRIQAIAPIEYLMDSAVLIPLPLHPKRQQTRGFNQSEDIARSIGCMCGIPVMQLLERTTTTSSQATLPHHLRAMNMDHAFSLAVPQEEYETLVEERLILILVDDVSTTGTTLASAARALPVIQDVQLWGAVVARG